MMEKPTNEMLVAKLKRNLRNNKDHTTLWSQEARRRHLYNRMDPDPDLPEPETDASPTRSGPNITRDRRGNIKQVSTKEDWKRFWVERLRRIVDAPHLTDKDISDAVERSRRVFLRQREDNSTPHIDPDLPLCYYWDKFEVANWVESVGLPTVVKKMLLNFDIDGRHLVTLDANKLLQMGMYELGAIKTVTKAVREVLGLPHTNGLRAIARVPPLETFLKMKVRTGPQSDMLTFKDFCKEQRIEYEPVRRQMLERYQPISGCCRVEIQPHPKEDVKWIPVPVHNAKVSPHARDSNYDFQRSDSGLSSNPSTTSLLDEIPTVEELATNALLRNTFIPKILNDIVEKVFEKVAENKRNRRECLRHKQQVANEIVKDQLDKIYSEFRITNPEDKLQFVTIIAEELVEDVMRAREILEDIDKFQKRVKTKLPEEDIDNLQRAVAHYVQSIMPVVVSAALKEMEESSAKLHCELDTDNARFDDSTSDSSQNDINLSENPEQSKENPGDEFEVVWDRTFNQDYNSTPFQ